MRPFFCRHAILTHLTSVSCLSGWLLLFVLLIVSHAQVVTNVVEDATLGTTVIPNGSGVHIGGGTQMGSNLFHSFQNFTVGTGETARFMDPQTGVNNILSRVTGGNMSVIDGTLQSDIPGANLFLLNPSGVMFGSNARLNVHGSFHASTADYIQLGVDGRFVADPGLERDQLTISDPSAFGFLGANAGSVTIEGLLEVPMGEALSVVGGDIHIDGGDLEAPSGWINLIAVTSEADIPLIDGTRIGSVPERLDGEMVIGRSSEVAIRGAGGGVFIRGGRLRLENQAAIISLVSGGNEDQGGDVDIGVEQLDLSGGASISTNTFGVPRGGRIIINANKMTVTGNSFIMSDAFSSGSGGEINVSVNESLVIDGETTISSLTRRAGHAGEINIHATDSLIIDGETTISSSTLRTGNAGKG